MPQYEFVCHPCKLLWEKEYSMKNAPSRSKCPECNKLSHQNFQAVAVHFKGDCHTNRRLANKENNSKVEQKRFSHFLVDKTKESVEKTSTDQFYNKMVPSETFFEHYSDYTIKPVNTREKEEGNRIAASIGRTVDALGAYHRNQPRRNEPIKD